MCPKVHSRQTLELLAFNKYCRFDTFAFFSGIRISKASLAFQPKRKHKFRRTLFSSIQEVLEYSDTPHSPLQNKNSEFSAGIVLNLDLVALNVVGTLWRYAWFFFWMRVLGNLTKFYEIFRYVSKFSMYPKSLRVVRPYLYYRRRMRDEYTYSCDRCHITGWAGTWGRTPFGPWDLGLWPFSSWDLGPDPFLNLGPGTWGTLRGAWLYGARSYGKI